MIEPARNRRSEARLRVVNEAGDLYAAESSDGLWIKIGFSTRLAERLKEIDSIYQCAPFKLLGSTRSTYRMEQMIHRALRPFHHLHIAAGKELYPAAPTVRFVAERITAHETFGGISLDERMMFHRWCRAAAGLVESKRAAVTAHRERFEKMWAVEDAYMARLRARIAARQMAKGASA
jgi:hypothetical protein